MKISKNSNIFCNSINRFGGILILICLLLMSGCAEDTRNSDDPQDTARKTLQYAESLDCSVITASNECSVRQQLIDLLATNVGVACAVKTNSMGFEGNLSDTSYLIIENGKATSIVDIGQHTDQLTVEKGLATELELNKSIDETSQLENCTILMQVEINGHQVQKSF